jgi:hypothetical protein
MAGALAEVLTAEYTLNVLPVVILLLTVACAVLLLMCGDPAACGGKRHMHWRRGVATLVAGAALAYAVETEFDRRYHS